MDRYIAWLITAERLFGENGNKALFGEENPKLIAILKKIANKLMVWI